MRLLVCWIGLCRFAFGATSVAGLYILFVEFDALIFVLRWFGGWRTTRARFGNADLLIDEMLTCTDIVIQLDSFCGILDE